MSQREQKNIAILCNTKAGNGRSISIAHDLRLALEKRNITNTAFSESWPSSFDGFTEVYIVGGDGTLNYFINQYPAIRIPLAIFKGGTGNDFHWQLYGKKNTEEQLALVLASTPRAVDAGQCNGRLFLNGAGIGFDGSVAKALTGKKKIPGKTSFLLTVLKKIFSYRSRNYKVQSLELNWSDRALLIAMANGQRAGGGFHVAPAAIVDDGWLDLVIIHPMPVLKRLRYLPMVEKGKHLGQYFIDHVRTKEVVVSSPAQMDAHLDGEYCTDVRMEFVVLPGRFLFLF